MSLLNFVQKIPCSDVGNRSNVLTWYLVNFFVSFMRVSKHCMEHLSMHGIFQAFAAVRLRPLPFPCATSSKNEGLPDGIILRNTPAALGVNLFRYVY
jgi:hypothetical protein